jgi:hypothetical protein
VPLDSHIIVPCEPVEDGGLWAQCPDIEGVRTKFAGWWWERLGDDPAWPHGVWVVQRGSKRTRRR